MRHKRHMNETAFDAHTEAISKGRKPTKTSLQEESSFSAPHQTYPSSALWELMGRVSQQ